MTKNRQPQWNLFEAAILLDAFHEVQKKERSKSEIIKNVSAALRQLAINQGQIIDDIYRNENGISYQLRSIESACKGKTVVVPATKLFSEVVTIYDNDRERFSSILEEARKMIYLHSNKESFLAWSSYVIPKKQRKWVEDNLLLIEQYALEKKLIFEPLFMVSSISTLKRVEEAIADDKLFQYKNKKNIRSIIKSFDAYILFCTNETTAENTQKETSEETTGLDNQLPAQKKNTVEDRLNTESANLNNGVQKILLEHYRYGFRYKSLRELMRFRQFADEIGVSLPESDEELKAIVLSLGTVVEEKVFFISESLPTELEQVVEDIFSTGAEVIYYECLFSNDSGWMQTHTIASVNVLKEYLMMYVEGWYFAKQFMIKGARKTEKQAVTAEIKRVWGNKQTNNVHSISERLPYIPLDNILRVITGNDSFSLSAEGEYLLTERFIVSQNESDSILAFVDAACDKDGFCPLSDVPLGDIEENNYNLSKLAIYNAIYKKVLAHKYHLKGKILSKDNSKLDTVLLLKQEIKEKSKCTFDEIEDKVVELTGGTNRQYAFQALYDEMIRVEKNLFVPNETVSFDVEEIDNVLFSFVTDHFAAIRDITTFAMFPLCGQNWNHYLLESYCYKYSHNYCLHVNNFNDKNAGIIAEKDYNKRYEEMLAIELARSGIELKPEVAETYLFNAGYIAKSKYSKIGVLIQQANELRKEG